MSSLWRAVRQAEMQAGPAPAAAISPRPGRFSSPIRQQMRDRLLPLVAETMVAGGEIATATALLGTRKDDPTLDLARGMLQEARGDSAGALALTTVDAIQGPAGARTRRGSCGGAAACQRCDRCETGGRLTGSRCCIPGVAMPRTGRCASGWRSSGRTRAVAMPRLPCCARRGAIPGQQGCIHAKADRHVHRASCAAMPADALPPLELVALIEENADLLPDGADGEALEARLADRLLALDLPKPCGAGAGKAYEGGADRGRARRFWGAVGGDASARGRCGGCVAALSASDAADLPPELVERRSLLLARVRRRAAAIRSRHWLRLAR